MKMHTSQQGIDLIKRFEGLELHSYLDAVGIPTIGYGSIAIGTTPVKLGMTITLEQAEQYLRDELARFELVVNEVVTAPINQRQFDALVSFVYNLGAGNLRKSTLLKLVNQWKYAEAQPQFLRWNRAKGKVLKGLTRRRLDEAALFGPLSRTELVALFHLETAI